MMRSLYSGVSGLKTHQTKMDVIGNNISNVNTVAFKSSSTTFSDIMYQTTSGATGATATTGGKNAKQIGLGVMNGATKVSITASGAAQSTGDGFDIRLVDSNNTNFFVVSNGKENLFTRAGSFYLDGNGNLAMTTTGYIVQGWQVSPEDENAIVKDVVSPLRIMTTENMTAEPEATTNAVFSGVIDKNDTDVTSDGGYYRNLNFYDNLGYSYTAKFAIKVIDPDAKTYSIELCNIYDDQNKDILKEYMLAHTDEKDNSKFFGGAAKPLDRTYAIDGSVYKVDGSNISFTKKDSSGNEKTYTCAMPTEPDKLKEMLQSGTIKFSDGASGTISKSVKEVFPTLKGFSSDATVSYANGKITTTTTVSHNIIKFNESDGTFSTIYPAEDPTKTGDTATLTLDGLLGAEFRDIEIDFTGLLNYDNGGSSTVDVDRGDLDGYTGAGKALGALTGVSVDGSGKIYGTYDNGNTKLLGQIAVAQFANASGLEELGDNCYGTTLNSGFFDGIGVEVTADGGSMSTGQLEMSNVDLSSEFTEMIVTQRGFQANSRIITTSDTLLEELINLKR